MRPPNLIPLATVGRLLRGKDDLGDPFVVGEHGSDWRYELTRALYATYERAERAEAEVKRLRAQVDVAIKRAEKRGLTTDVRAIRSAYRLAERHQATQEEEGA